MPFAPCVNHFFSLKTLKSYYKNHPYGLFFFFFFLFLAVPRGMWDLPQPGIEPVPPALGAWSHNHWTTREVPYGLLNVHDRTEVDK